MRLLSGITLILLCSNVFAFDLAKKHQAACAEPKLKSLTGAKGNCQVVISVKPASEISGSCSGKLTPKLNCSLTYSLLNKVARTDLGCGSDPANPMLKDVSDTPEVQSYTVSYVITKENGTKVIVNDSKKYTAFETFKLTVVVGQEAEDSAKKNGIMVFDVFDEPSEMRDVICN